MPKCTFNVFPSQDSRYANEFNTAFATQPVTLDMGNAEEILKNDHTPICFDSGYIRVKNFRYATAIPGDIDNKNIANPMEQQTHDAVSARLKKRRINHCIYSSRNDNKSKDGRTARPKFHVLLPLSEPLTDGKKYLGFCGWFIREFNGDPHVKGLTQKLFGFGGHPNPVILFYQDGLCIDEVLTDDDLFVNTPSPVGPPQRTATRVTSNLKLPLDKPRSR